MDELLRSSVPADIKDFLAHWRAARKDHPVPLLCDYLDLPPFAYQRDTAIVDLMPDAQMRFRLFGGGLSFSTNQDLTGQDVLSHFTPAARAAAQEIARGMLARPRGYLVHRTMRCGSIEVAAEGVGLPLRNARTGAKHIVGFTSNIAKRTNVANTDEAMYVTEMKFMRWIDIDAA